MPHALEAYRLPDSKAFFQERDKAMGRPVPKVRASEERPLLATFTYHNLEFGRTVRRKPIVKKE